MHPNYFLSLIEYLETERPEIKSIRLSTNENNMAMQRIATKSGFKKWGPSMAPFVQVSCLMFMNC